MNLTLADLNQFARLGDAELRATGQGAERHIEAREGSWGGRLVRNLKVNLGDEDRSQKKAEYGDAKRAVFDALVKEYGLDVARKAFVAGAGRLSAQGGVESSVDHPLNGRQISRMIERAEIERSHTDGSTRLLRSRLEALALHDDLEIASDGRGGLTATKGRVGEQMLRSIGASDDQGLYIESKRMVFGALRAIYGEDIARSVFVAVDGTREDEATLLASSDKASQSHLEKLRRGLADPRILSSANHPLTGAQLRKMLEMADEIAGTRAPTQPPGTPRTPAQRFIELERLLTHRDSAWSGAKNIVHALVKAFDLDAVRGPLHGGRQDWDYPNLDVILRKHLESKLVDQGTTLKEAASKLQQELVPLLRRNPDVPVGLLRRVDDALTRMQG
jgi:hypothetical protein